MQFNQVNQNAGNVINNLTPTTPAGLYIGLDLGNNGGIAFLDSKGSLLRLEHMPTKKDTRGKVKVDPKGLYQILSWVRPVTLLATEFCRPFGEKGRIKQSRTSAFSFGNNCGRSFAVIELLGIPFVEADPKLWKSKILAYTPKDKPAAIQYCNARWPGACKDHDGLADALCLAAYALLTATGRSVTS